MEPREWEKIVYFLHCLLVTTFEINSHFDFSMDDKFTDKQTLEQDTTLGYVSRIFDTAKKELSNYLPSVLVELIMEYSRLDDWTSMKTFLCRKPDNLGDAIFKICKFTN